MDERNRRHENRRAGRRDWILENLWLQYFNTALRKAGEIPDDVYKRMQRAIQNRPAAHNKGS